MIYNLASYHRHLGDELQFSWAPEVLHKLGHDVKLYIGPDVLPFSNDGIKKFVWGHNPFIKGESKENWNFGDIPGLKYEDTTGAFLTNWARAFGIPETETLPKIYYQPIKTSPWVYKYGIIELSGISMKNEYQQTKVVNSVMRIIKQYPKVKFYQLITKHQSNPIKIDGLENMVSETLENISDIICNSQVFISLSSGLHSLAAAIQRFNPNLSQYCVLPASKYDFFMKSKLFIYPNVIYIQEG